MITIPLQKSNMPLYEQIYRYIKKEIQTGNLSSESRIPSKRKLASHLGVSINSVDMAYGQLVSEGYIESVPRKGYYVCRLDGSFNIPSGDKTINAEEHSHDKTIIDFSPGDIDYYAFPFDIWRKLLKKCFDEQKQDIIRQTPIQGDITLRKAISQYLHESRGVNCTPQQIVISAGTDYLLQLLCLLLEKTGTVIMENPVYNNAYSIFEGMRLKTTAVNLDQKGMPAEPLHDRDISAIYITPSHQFPLGFSMPISRRAQLLSYAKERKDCYIIEDDYDSEFRYNNKPISAMQSIDGSGRVIYIGSFSKSIAPAVRISYMVLPERLLQLYQERLSYYSCPVSSFEQRIVSEFITGGHFERHLNKMRKIYKHKREYLVERLEVFGYNADIIGENAGHHLLLRLKTGMSECEMCSSAALAGIKVYGISKYFFGKVPDEYKSTVLLGYGGLEDQQIADGIAILYKTWR